MAIVKHPKKLTGQVLLDGGIVDGKPVTYIKSVSRFKTNATDENVRQTLAAIFSLQKRDILAFNRLDLSQLVEE